MNKPTLIALAVFALLAVTFFATREPKVAVGVQKLELAKVSFDAFEEMSFGPIVLRKESGKWTVDKHPADEAEAMAAANALAELKAEDFVTDRPEKHAELEVDATKGLIIKASTATGVVRELVLGKASRSGGAYVREAKSNAVFAINGGLPSLARRDLTAWRKKSIATAKVEDLTRVTLTPPAGSPWSLVSDAGSWKLEAQTPKDYRFDPVAAQRLVAQLANLSAQDFLTGPPEPPLTQVKAELKDGKTIALQLGAKRPDGTHALAVEGDPQVYALPAWQAEQLLKDPEGLRDLRLLHFEPALVERLSVSSPGKKTIVVKEGENWKLQEPKSADFDAQQVMPQLTRLASLRGVKFSPEIAEPKSAVEVELKLKGGTTLRLSLGELAAKSDDGPLFTINSADKTWLEAGAEIFKTPPAPPPGNAMRLDQLPPEVRQQLEAQMRQQKR